MKQLPNDERLLDLLAARASEGLSPAEQSELDALLRQHPDVDADAFETTAAAIDLAFARAESTETEGLPDDLRARLLADATAAPAEPVTNVTGFRVPATRTAPAASGGFRGFKEWGGWAVAAAALAFAAWLGTREVPAPVVAPEVPPTVAEQRQALIDGGALQVAWATPEIPAYAGVQGDVVWSSAEQRGFMRLSNLPVNDPAEAQYQLWIVDPGRDAEPVDGGVFDMPAAPAGGAAIIPIDAKLPIGRPAVFAITLEKPGGVVVSEGPLLVLAPVSG
jgi:hypothetical protein